MAGKLNGVAKNGVNGSDQPHPFEVQLRTAAGLGGMQGLAVPHDFAFPSVLPPRGPARADTSIAAALLELNNFVRLASIPRRKAQAAASLITRAITYKDQWLWTRTMTGLATESAVAGHMLGTVKDVLVADRDRSMRAESMGRLTQMGPQAEGGERQ